MRHERGTLTTSSGCLFYSIIIEKGGLLCGKNITLIENVIANQTANTQRILDTLCADKIDAKNEQIMALERQLAMANLAASQTAQTAEIISRLPAATTTA